MKLGSSKLLRAAKIGLLGGPVVYEALPLLTTVGATAATDATVGRLYGAIRKNDPGETTMDAIMADALAFETFVAGGAVMGRRLGGIGTSLALGGAAGAVEPADSLGERAGNVGMGMATFGLVHGVTSGVGA